MALIENTGIMKLYNIMELNCSISLSRPTSELVSLKNFEGVKYETFKRFRVGFNPHRDEYGMFPYHDSVFVIMQYM